MTAARLRGAGMRRGLAAALAVLAAAGATGCGDSEPASQTAAPAGQTATTPHTTAPPGTGAQAITIAG